MKRRAATALFVFFVAMACFGILSRAVSSTGTALVAAEAPSTQTFAQEAIEADGGTAFDPGAATGGEAVPGCATVPEGEAPEASVDANAPAAAREYGSCAPLAAVHREGARSYVYVVAEQGGILGRRAGRPKGARIRARHECELGGARRGSRILAAEDHRQIG